MAGHVGYAVQVQHMFANFSWMAPNLTVAEQAVVNNWKTPWTGPYLHLVCLIAFNVPNYCIASSSTNIFLL